MPELDQGWVRLGPAAALQNDDDWITAEIMGRPVFVQRFGGDLRGFENLCAHRFYPLRTEARGNGPILCGFHHWRYAADGSLRGAPQCREQFGVKPDELGAKLQPIEIQSLDGEVFGRLLPRGGKWEPLRYAPMGADWARPMSDPAAFAAEQAALGEGWAFLGMARERRTQDAQETARCGDFLFGRPSGAGPDLETWLGDLFPILAVLSKAGGRRHRASFPVAANWRLCLHITLEDYHLLAVHPDTVGRDGPRLREDLGYFCAGPHIAQFTENTSGALKAMAQACREGTWRSSQYRIFHVFPNLLVSHFSARDEYWYVQVQHVVPLSSGRSRIDSWIFPAAVAPLGARPPHDRWMGRWTRPWRSAIVDRMVARILREDTRACATLQRSVAQIDRPPFLAAVEERIGWFEEAYRAAMTWGRANP